MASLWTTVLTIYYVLWLLAVLILLFLNWRGSTTRLYRLQQALIETAMKSAEAAHKAAEAAYLLAQQQQGNKPTP